MTALVAVKVKLIPLVKLNADQIERLGADVLQLNELEVIGVVRAGRRRMIHDLGDRQGRGADYEGADGRTGPMAGDGWIAAHSAAGHVVMGYVVVAGEDAGVVGQGEVDCAAIGDGAWD